MTGAEMLATIRRVQADLDAKCPWWKYRGRVVIRATDYIVGSGFDVYAVAIDPPFAIGKEIGYIVCSPTMLQEIKRQAPYILDDDLAAMLWHRAMIERERNEQAPSS